MIINRDEKIIRRMRVTIVIDYPLAPDAVPAEFRVESRGGWTAPRLLRAVTGAYKKMFADEAKHIRETGRPKYGIWGHALNDLAISGVKYNSRTGKVCLDVSS